jgi:hypothetical protein
MTERWTYRGYQIEPRREWSQWCVLISPTSSELPILPQSALQTLMPRKDDAIAEAKDCIDRILLDLDSFPRL